jgi:hypothetical protein
MTCCVDGVSDQEYIVLMCDVVFYLPKIVSHVCGFLMRCDQGCGFKDSKEEGPTSCKIGQLTSNMGLEWRKICIHASKATTPSKGFLHLEAHMLKGTVRRDLRWVKSGINR